MKRKNALGERQFAEGTLQKTKQNTVSNRNKPWGTA
jgi:hypothetical protein